METQAETALSNGADHEERGMVALTPRAILTKEALKADTEQRTLLAEYVKRHMVEGVDYGVIPGTPKPTLLKPGAEKLTDLFRCTPKFALIHREEDFERGFFNYMFRIRLYQRDADAVVAEGYGSANSYEGRYRWRQANRKCPQCSKEAIIKGKAEYGGGWLCFAKKGGCGAKWQDGAQEIEGQEVGRVENDDLATYANTVLKMAKKRALVDGAIALARCSDMFTQDVEDLHRDDAPPPPKPESARTAEAPKSNRSALNARAKAMWEWAQQCGIELPRFKGWMLEVLGRDVASNRLTEDELAQLRSALPELTGKDNPGEPTPF